MKLLLTLSLFLMPLASLILAEVPALEEGIEILDDALPLNKGPYSVPAVCDWNNDGAKDLVVGQWNEGYIYLFLNQGTDLNPLFNDGILIEAGGVPITTTHL